MQEWKKELCREQPETLQELGKCNLTEYMTKRTF